MLLKLKNFLKECVMNWKYSLIFFLLLALLPACTAKKKPPVPQTSQNIYPKDEDLSAKEGVEGIPKINLQTFNGLPAKRAWQELGKIFGWKEVDFKGKNSTIILSAKEVYPWEALLTLAREGNHQFTYSTLWRRMVVEDGDFPYVLARVVGGFLVAIPLVEREGKRCSFKVEIWKSPKKTKKNTFSFAPALSVKVSFDGGENLPYTPAKDRSHSFSFDHWNYQFEGPLPKGAREMSISLAFKKPDQGGGGGKIRNLKVPLSGRGKGKGVEVSSSKFEKKGKKSDWKPTSKCSKGGNSRI